MADFKRIIQRTTNSERVETGVADLQPNEICIVEDGEELIYKDRNGKYISVSKDKYKVDTIEELKKSRKYKVGDVIQVSGYYVAGDGSGHTREKKPEGYIGEDSIIGDDGSIWGIVHSGEIKAGWFGVTTTDPILDTAILKKIENYDCDIVNFSNKVITLEITENAGIGFNINKNIKNSVFILKPNAFENYNLLNISTSNLYIENIKAFGDIKTHIGTTGEWGHTLAIQKNVKDVTFRNCLFNEGWGDGVYIGPFVSTDEEIPQRINFYDCIFNDSGRNNLSVISLKDSNFINCYFGVADRTLPKASVDLEPNNNYKGIKNINFINCVTEKSFEVQVYDPNITVDEIKLTNCNVGSLLVRGANAKVVLNSTVVSNSITVQEGGKLETYNSTLNEIGGLYFSISDTTISNSSINFKKGVPTTLELNNSTLAITNSKVENINRINTTPTTTTSTIILDNIEFNNMGYNSPSFILSSSKLSADSKINKCNFNVGVGTNIKIFDTTFAGSQTFNKYSEILGGNLDQENSDYAKKTLSVKKIISSESELIDAIIQSNNGVTVFDSSSGFNAGSNGVIYARSQPDTSGRNGSYAIVRGGSISYPNLTIYFLKNHQTKEFTKHTISLGVVTTLNTPYYTSKMEQQGILQTYYAYLDEIHEYKKQSNSEIMALKIRPEPILPKVIEDFAKEYNLI